MGDDNVADWFDNDSSETSDDGAGKVDDQTTSTEEESDLVDWLDEGSSETSDNGSEQVSEQTTSTGDNQDLSHLAQVPFHIVNGGSWGEVHCYNNSGDEKFDGSEAVHNENETPAVKDMWDKHRVNVGHYPDDTTWVYASYDCGTTSNQGHVAVEGNGSLEDLLSHVQEQLESTDEPTESVEGFRISTSGPDHDPRIIEALADPEPPEKFNIWVADPEHEDYRRNGELLNEDDESYDIDDYRKEIADALDNDKHVRVNIGGEAEFKTDVPKVISYLSNEHPETAIVDSDTEAAQSDNPLLSQPDGYISVNSAYFKNPGSDEPQQTSSDNAGGPVSTLYELIK